MGSKYTVVLVMSVAVIVSFFHEATRINTWRNDSWQDVSAKSGSSDTSPGLSSRIAYVITVNATSPRTLRSKRILEEAGFLVAMEIAPKVVDRRLVLPNETYQQDLVSDEFDKVYSNKLAHLSIFEKIIADQSRPWGYVFEDDILLLKQNFTVENDLVAKATGMESRHPHFLYLGICGPLQMNQTDRYCGRCAHAYGLSREGAATLIEFDKANVHPDPRRAGERIYMDVVTDIWCASVGGFPVHHIELTSNQFADHKGVFMQDRQTFKSLISN